MIFRSRPLPKGYSIRSEVPFGGSNYLVLRDETGRRVAQEMLYVTSARRVERKLRRIAWVDYRGRVK